jgi:hypothetical protein
MENGKTNGLYKVVYGEDVWAQIVLFVADRDTMDKYKDESFTYIKNDNDEVDYVRSHRGNQTEGGLAIMLENLM